MGFISRKVLPACANMCVCCPALRSRSRKPVKRYKKLLSEIFSKSLVLAIEELFKNMVSNVVFMGMGEPMMNLNAVLEAHRCLNKDIEIGQIMITISTMGVPNTIKKLASYKLQSTLAVRSYSPAPRRRDYSVSPRIPEHSQSPRDLEELDAGHARRRSYSPTYEDDRRADNGYVERQFDDEEGRAGWRSPGCASRSPPGSRSRSADLSPAHSR